MLILVFQRSVIKGSLHMLTCWTKLNLSHESLSSSYPRSSASCQVLTSTVTTLRKLSDTRTFERYLVVSELVAELTTVAMSKVTDTLAVWDEDPDSFDDFAAQCRWYRDGLRKSEQRLATAHVVRLFAARRWQDVKSDPEAGQQMSTRMVRIGIPSLANPRRNVPSCDSRTDKVFG